MVCLPRQRVVQYVEALWEEDFERVAVGIIVLEYYANIIALIHSDLVRVEHILTSIPGIHPLQQYMPGSWSLIHNR